MINILVPTDFTPGSSSALKSALKIASDLGGRVYLMHSFAPPYSRDDIFVPVIHVLEKDAKEILQREIEKINSDKEFGNILCEGLTYMGPFEDALKECVLEKNIHLVLMNTHGASGIMKELIGSNAVSVITKSNCAFLLLPYEYEFKKPEKVAMLINNDFLNHSFSLITGFLEKYNPQLLLFSESEIKFSGEEKSAIEKHLNSKSLTFLTLENKTEVDSIALENNAEWLVMFPSHHTFMEKLFHKSLTKEIASHAKLPLLIIN